MMYGLGGLAAALSDWIIKEKIEKSMEEGEKKKICKGVVQIEKYHNYGGAMNLLQDKPGLMKGIHTLVFSIVAIYTVLLLKAEGNAGNRAGAGFLLAGGFNNLCDRYRRGYVVDYIRFQTPFRRLNRMIFNLSDFLIVIGAVLLVLFLEKK